MSDLNPVVREKQHIIIRAPKSGRLRFFVRDEQLWSADADGNESVMLTPGAVLSVFGRLGAVAAASGDYLASQIENDSTVTGANIKLALEWLLNNRAPLDGSGKVPVANLPDAVLGSVNYQGTWDAGANDPTLDDSTGEKGWYYVVDFAGTQDLGNGAITFAVGDWVIHNGLFWERLDGMDQVTSVAGKQGAVTLEPADIVGLVTSLGGFPPPLELTAHVAIPACSFVFILPTGKARVADATAGERAHAFTPVAVDEDDTFSGFQTGQFAGFSGLVPGTHYWLGAAGVLGTSPASGTGHAQQYVGVAVSATKMAVHLTPPTPTIVQQLAVLTAEQRTAILLALGASVTSSGTGEPDPDDGTVELDWYLDNDTRKLYQKTAVGVWTHRATLPKEVTDTEIIVICPDTVERGAFVSV